MEVQIANFEGQKYICQNCATPVVTPSLNQSVVLIYEDGIYYWKTNKEVIEFKPCCEHPFIEELK